MRYLRVVVPSNKATACLRSIADASSHRPWLRRFSSAQLPPDSAGKERLSSASSARVRSLKEMPGPRGLPLFGTALEWARGGRMDKMSEVIRQRIDKYGTIYREKMFPGMPLQVVIAEPRDVEVTFRADGQFPFRPEGGEAQIVARTKAKMPLGLFLSQGEEWHQNRLPIQKFTMVPRKVAEYHTAFNDVAEDLLENIKAMKDNETSAMKDLDVTVDIRLLSTISDVTELLFRWSFESIAMYMLGKRMGSLKLNPPPDCVEFILSVHQLFKTLLDLAISLPVHNLWENKAMRQAIKAQENVFRIAHKYVKERVEEIDLLDEKILAGSEEAPPKVDFLTYLMHSGTQNMEDVTANVIDMLMAGVDTTSLTLAWCLYLLATHPETQTKLQEEVRSVLRSERVVTPEHISHMHYLRHCIKETMRMYPISGINNRRTNQDLVLSGYKIPAGTEILMPLMAMGRLPQLFPEPDCFKPERWSTDAEDTPNVFASLPFGFGPRMCVGRRIAELELHIALAQLMRTYRVEYDDDKPMNCTQSFLVKPDRQLSLAFIEV